jgi:hypothetical protein
VNNPDRKSERKPKYRKRIYKVTIALGVICGGTNRPPGIVLASDSQTTFPGAAKSLDTQKISIVNFLDAQVLVAEAGSADLAGSAIAEMQKIAKDVKLENKDTVQNVARQAVRQIRSQLVEMNKDCGFSGDDWKRFFFEDHNFELLVAHFWVKTPSIFRIDLESAIPTRETKLYASIGCGRNIADFLLHEYQRADPVFENGLLIAGAVVEKTIDHADGCGRPTWVGMLHPVPDYVLSQYEEIQTRLRAADRPDTKQYFKSEARLVAPRYMGLMVEELKSEEAQESISKNQKLRTMMKRITERNVQAILDEL